MFTSSCLFLCCVFQIYVFVSLIWAKLTVTLSLLIERGVWWRHLATQHPSAPYIGWHPLPIAQSLSARPRALVYGVSNTHRFKPHILSLILSSSHSSSERFVTPREKIRLYHDDERRFSVRRLEVYPLGYKLSDHRKSLEFFRENPDLSHKVIPHRRSRGDSSNWCLVFEYCTARACRRKLPWAFINIFP